MIYRNDTEAALARADALAVENTRLAAENAKLRQGGPQHAEHTSKRPIAMAALVGVACAGVIAAVATSPSHRSASRRVEQIDNKLAALSETSAKLDECATKLVRDPRLDAARTDPHAPGHVSALDAAHTTGCRAEIDDRLTHEIISSKERDALERWADAELQLELKVDLVMTYYGDDPYRLDGYSTAPQLWREYNRALDDRNGTLENWRITLR